MNHVFTPFQWGKMTLSNRLVMAPMCMYSANEEGDVQPFHLAHYTARAYGGVGLVIVEATAVEARGRISINDLGIYADQHLAGLHQLVANVHAAGTPIAIQLAHAGRKSGDLSQPSIAPSAIPFTVEWRKFRQSGSIFKRYSSRSSSLFSWYDLGSFVCRRIR
jgi:NADPH2 dehydrogenase